MVSLNALVESYPSLLFLPSFPSLPFLFFFFSVLGIEPKASNLLAKHYQLSYAPSPFVSILFLKLGFHKFTQAGLELGILLILPPE
jgi:hypothetical protein